MSDVKKLAYYFEASYVLILVRFFYFSSSGSESNLNKDDHRP